MAESVELAVADLLASMEAIEESYAQHGVDDEYPFGFAFEYLNLLRKVLTLETTSMFRTLTVLDSANTSDLLPLLKAVARLNFAKSSDDVLPALRGLSPEIGALVAGAQDRLATRKAQEGADSHDIVNHLLRQLEIIETQRQLLDIKVAATSDLGEVERIVEATTVAAGAASENTLAKHFASMATSERSSQRGWLAVGLVSAFLLAIALPIVLLVVADSDWHVQLRALTFAIPLGALVAWALNNYSHHRDVRLWARVLEVQLLTLEAYIAGLDSADRKKIRADLGTRVFGPHSPATSGDGDVAVEMLRTAFDNLNVRIDPQRGALDLN